MPKPKYQIYKHVKLSGVWRYCRAAEYSNHKIKPHIVVIGGQEDGHEETHPKGRYFIRDKGQWVDVGTDPLEKQRFRSKLIDQVEYGAANFWRNRMRKITCSR